MIVDLRLTIDGLILKDDESIDNYIEKINEITNSNYPIIFEVDYMEKYE